MTMASFWDRIIRAAKLDVNLYEELWIKSNCASHCRSNARTGSPTSAALTPAALMASGAVIAPVTTAAAVAPTRASRLVMFMVMLHVLAY